MIAEPALELSLHEARKLYLDLVKRCVLNLPYVDAELNPIQPHGRLRSAVLRGFATFGIQLAHTRRGNYTNRVAGADFSDVAHSMISLRRLDNIEQAIETVLRENIPGDFIETGVMRGGAVILMRAVLRAYQVTDRTVWAADSFAGLPAPNVEQYPADVGAAWHLRPLTEVSVESVRRNFDRYGLMDQSVRFVPGWFSDTLQHVPATQYAIIRLDGDLYESTMDALVPLYPKLAPGGFLIVDDYNLPACRQAIHDYRAAHEITEELVTVDAAAVYWRKRA